MHNCPALHLPYEYSLKVERVEVESMEEFHKSWLASIYDGSCQSGTSRPGDIDWSEQCCAPARHCIAGGGAGHAELRPSTGMMKHGRGKLAGGSIFIGLFWGGSMVIGSPGDCALPAVANNAEPNIAKSMSTSFRGPQILMRMSHPSKVGPRQSSPASYYRQTDHEPFGCASTLWRPRALSCPEPVCLTGFCIFPNFVILAQA
jgi:hypothetical protein